MKRPNLHDCQAEYEKTLYNHATRVAYCRCLDRIVRYFGPERNPADVFRHELPGFWDWMKQNYVQRPTTTYWVTRVGSAFYTWMDMYEYVPPDYNPFRRYRKRTVRPDPLIYDVAQFEE